MSNFETQCPHCQATVEVPEELVDKPARCSDCYCKFIIHRDHQHEVIEKPEDFSNYIPEDLENFQDNETDESSAILNNFLSEQQESEEYRNYRKQPKKTKQLFFLCGFILMILTITVIVLFHFFVSNSNSNKKTIEPITEIENQ